MAFVEAEYVVFIYYQPISTASTWMEHRQGQVYVGLDKSFGSADDLPSIDIIVPPRRDDSELLPTHLY